MSPKTGRCHSLTLICEVYRVPRSTVYRWRKRASEGSGSELRKPGPKTDLSDEALLEEIRTVLRESPFLGEGHRQV